MTEHASGMTHLRADGSAHMVDVGGKPETKRTAVAEGFFRTTPEVIAALRGGDLPKGEALGTARIAGIMAAKRTADLVPLCHPLALTKVDVDLEVRDDDVRVEATVSTKGLTGVEMEALTAVSVAALTLYDMVKALDHQAGIDGIRVLSKSGGKSGDWSVA